MLKRLRKLRFLSPVFKIYSYFICLSYYRNLFLVEWTSKRHQQPPSQAIKNLPFLYLLPPCLRLYLILWLCHPWVIYLWNHLTWNHHILVWPYQPMHSVRVFQVFWQPGLQTDMTERNYCFSFTVDLLQALSCVELPILIHSWLVPGLLQAYSEVLSVPYRWLLLLIYLICSTGAG